MKFTVDKSELLRELQILNKIVPKKSMLNVIQYVKLDVFDDTLTLSATNLQQMLESILSVKQDESKVDGVLVSPKILIDTLKVLDDPFVCEISNDYVLKLITDSGEYNIQGYAPEDFPSFNNNEFTGSLTLDKDTLANALNKTSFATSNDDLKPAMTGVHLRSNDSTMVDFVSTDAHRLSKLCLFNINPDRSTIDLIIPDVAVVAVQESIKSMNDDTILINFCDKNIEFSIDNKKINSPLIDARFPDYNSVIPKASPHEVIFDKDELINVIKKLVKYTNDVSKLARFYFNKETFECKITAEDENFKNNAFEHIEFKSLNNKFDLEIGFNLELMSECLSVLDGDKVKVQLDTAGRAAVLLDNDATDSVYNHTLLLMPVNLLRSY